MKTLGVIFFLASIGLSVFIENKKPIDNMTGCVKLNDTTFYNVPYHIEKCDTNNLMFVFDVRVKRVANPS